MKMRTFRIIIGIFVAWLISGINLIYHDPISDFIMSLYFTIGVICSIEMIVDLIRSKE